MDKLAYTSILL